MINPISAIGSSRAPRSILMIGDKMVKWTSWTIEHSGVHEAGTIHVTVAAPYEDWRWWIQQTETIIEVYAGVPPNTTFYTTADLTPLMTARIDDMSLDPATMTLTLTGRDLAALFIDKKISGDFKNQTSSQVVQKMFDDISTTGGVTGMSAVIDPTDTLIGSFVSADVVQLQKQSTAWTLMTYLAQHETMQCFVLGKTLYFGNFTCGSLGNAISNEPYSIVFQPPTKDRPYAVANAQKLSLSRNMTLAGNVSLKVSSMHGQKNVKSKATATAANPNLTIGTGAQSVQKTQTTEYSFPNLSQAECAKKATQMLNEMTKHELKLEATVPGDTVLFPWTPVIVSGTGTLLDDTYQIAKVSRTFDSSGYRMTLSCQTGSSKKEVKIT
jgi:hypothetical protein